MARVHSRIPVQNMQPGERLVYDAMARLPENWVVFHSCKEDYREDDRYVHYEADFVLLIPGRGLLVIEVKDWPQVRIEKGRWQSRRHDADSWKTHAQAPLEQANIALQKIMRSLTRCACVPRNPKLWPEHRHLAILTRCIPDDSCSNQAYSSLYLFGVDNLQHHIESLFVLNLPERMSDKRVEKITEALAPSVLFRMNLENYLQEMDAATAPILNLLPSLYDSTGGIRVEGCAGTGKTVMACAEAARLAAELPRDGQHRMLMLCFNHAMAYELRRHPLLAEQSEVLQVSNFHDFCIDSLLAPRRLTHLINDSGEGDRLPEAALNHLIRLLPELAEYDAVFVDEAQDFREIWWRIIRGLLKPGGKLYIFADQHQDLYGRYTQLPELPTRVHLSSNLRNARQIAGYSRAMLPPAEQTLQILPMSGDGIHVSPPADSPQERAAEVERIIRNLLAGNAHIQPRDIVVLSPWRTSHARCCLNLVQGLSTAPPGELPAQAAERRSACRRPGATQIFASTIKSFKGLEAAYIIVTDIIGLGESRGFDLKELYTACTRARYGLFLVPTSGGKTLVDSFSSARS